MDEKEERNGTSNDVKLISKDDADDNGYPAEADITSKL